MYFQLFILHVMAIHKDIQSSLENCHTKSTSIFKAAKLR